MLSCLLYRRLSCYRIHSIEDRIFFHNLPPSGGCNVQKYVITSYRPRSRALQITEEHRRKKHPGLPGIFAGSPGRCEYNWSVHTSCLFGAWGGNCFNRLSCLKCVQTSICSSIEQFLNTVFPIHEFVYIRRRCISLQCWTTYPA